MNDLTKLGAETFFADGNSTFDVGTRSVELMARYAVVLDVRHRQRIISNTSVQRHGGWFWGSEFALTSTPVAHTNVSSIEEREVWVRYENGQELVADIPAGLDVREGQPLELLFAVHGVNGELVANVVAALNRASLRYAVHSPNCELAALGMRGVVDWNRIWNGWSWSDIVRLLWSLFVVWFVSMLVGGLLISIGYGIFSSGRVDESLADPLLLGFSGTVIALRLLKQRRQWTRESSVRVFIERLRQRYA